MLSVYFRPGDDETTSRLALSMWRAVLEDLPQAAVEKAIMERVKSSDRSRPVPGEIREAALRHIQRQDPAQLRIEEQRPEDKPRISAVEAQEMANEFFGDDVPVMVNRMVGKLSVLDRSKS